MKMWQPQLQVGVVAMIMLLHIEYSLVMCTTMTHIPMVLELGTAHYKLWQSFQLITVCMNRITCLIGRKMKTFFQEYI